MLPAWATVVLALGGAAIGALTGLTAAALQRRTAKDQLTHQEIEAWRSMLIETTEAFIDAWHAFRWFLRERSMDSREARAFDAKAREQLDPLGTRCAQTIDKVMLVFGKNTECGKAAAEVDEKIWELKKEVHSAPTQWNTGTKRKIASLLDATNTAHVEFVRTAHVACRPERWKEPERNE
jgi:hypothetical protein